MLVLSKKCKMLQYIKFYPNVATRKCNKAKIAMASGAKYKWHMPL